MKNAYEIRKHFATLGDHNTSIAREEFEAMFRRTDERVTYTFGGWDGKSYDGESRTSRVFRAAFPGYEEIRFIKVGRHLHCIEEDWLMVEKATGESHPRAGWLIDVRRA